MTFALLEVLSLRKPLSRALARARPRTRGGLAFATLGSASLGLLKARLEWRLRRKNHRVRRLSAGASKALREPMEAALAVAMLGALALPLMVETGPEQATRPGGPSGQDARPVDDAGEDGDDLGLNGAIASW